LYGELKVDDTVATKPMSGTCAVIAVARISGSIDCPGRASGPSRSSGMSDTNTASNTPRWAMRASCKECAGSARSATLPVRYFQPAAE
jgi:hypothetical protein